MKKTTLTLRTLCLSGIFLLLGQWLNAQMAELVKDINPGSDGSIPITFVDFNQTSEGLAVADIFYFTADDGVHGVELWRSDGTEAGTQMVADINPGSGSSRPTWLTLVNGQILFFARTDAAGLELWRSDGTAAGTTMLKDFNPGPADGIRTFNAPQIRDMLVRDGVLYFAADSAGVYGNLCRSDGTPQGTYTIKSVCPTCASNTYTTGWFTLLNNTLYFIAGNDLWKSNGTPSGTTTLIDGDGYPGHFSQLKAAGNKLYFAGQRTSSIDVEPYYNNGSAGSATLLKDIGEGDFNSSNPRQFTTFGNKVYFIANQHLWSTTGTSAGTSEFFAQNLGNYSASKGDGQNLFAANGFLFFNAQGSSGQTEFLYSTNGTAGNITQMAQTNDYGFGELGLLQYGPKVCFWGDNGVSEDIWVSNGVYAFFYYANSSTVRADDLWLVGDYVYFFMDQLGSNVGLELYRLKLSPETPLAASISQLDFIQCNGAADGLLIAAASGGAPPYSYRWSVGGNFNQELSGVSAGTYTVTITDNVLNTAEAQITVTQPTAIALTLSAVNAHTGQSDGSATATVTGGTPAYTYAWSNGANTASISDLAAGVYQVTVNDANGCSKTGQVTVQLNTGTEEAFDEARWSIFPSPAHERVQVRWNDKPLNNMTLRLFNHNGALLREWQGALPEFLDVSELPAGVYALQLSAEGYNSRRSLAIMK